MKKLSKFLIVVSVSFILMLSGCDRNSGGLSYYQVDNNTNIDLTLHLYFSQSVYYNDTVFNIESLKSSDVFTQDDSGPGISRVMILMSADSIDFIASDSLLKRYRNMDTRYTKTPYSKEFYDSTYLNIDSKTIYVYSIELDDF